jgi:Domain of unknown function (DUF4920)
MFPRHMHRAALSVAMIALWAVSACTKQEADAAQTGATPVAHAEPAAAPEAAGTTEPQAGAAATTTAPAAATAVVSGQAGTVYGAGVSQTESVAMATLLADPKAYEGKAVRVEGTVTDVCPKRGCWFEMAGEQPGQKMRFKVRDGEMVFPMDAKGKYALAEGVVAVQSLSLEETRQYLEYQAREYGSGVDPASVTEPMTIVRLDGTGALIRDGK